MTFHHWGDDSVDWSGIGNAARYIGTRLRLLGRVNVSQWKEKYGTVRVYCTLGWNQFHCITHPGYVYSQYPRWLWRLDCSLGSRIVPLLNRLVIPYHQWLYRDTYRRALKKWPHLREEILDCADFSELLVGL